MTRHHHDFLRHTNSGAGCIGDEALDATRNDGVFGIRRSTVGDEIQNAFRNDATFDKTSTTNTIPSLLSIEHLVGDVTILISELKKS